MHGYSEEEYWRDEAWEWRGQKTICEPEWPGGEFSLPNHPVVCVSWYEATAYCTWLSERLQEMGNMNQDQNIRLLTE